MKRYAIPSLLAVVALSTVAGCSSSPANSSTAAGSTSKGATSSASPVTVAVLEPFSGPFGYLGTFVANSVKIELNKINKSGGLLGHKVVLETRDDQLSSQVTVSAARELTSDPEVKLVDGPSISALYNGVRPIYEQGKQLNCPLSADNDKSILGAKYGFLAGPTNDIIIPTLLQYYSQHGAKTIGAVLEHDATGEGVNATLMRLAPKYHLKYLGIQYYQSGAQNQIAQVQKLKSADLLFVSSTAPDAAETAISAGQVGYKGTLIGGDGLQSYVYVDAAGAEATHTVFGSEPLYNLTNLPKSQWPTAFAKFYTAADSKYGVETGPKSGVTQLKATPLAASCITAWATAVKKAGTFDATKVATVWEHLKIPAVDNPGGSSLSFTPSQHQFFSKSDQIAIYSWQHSAHHWFLKTLKPAAR